MRVWTAKIVFEDEDFFVSSVIYLLGLWCATW